MHAVSTDFDTGESLQQRSRLPPIPSRSQRRAAPQLHPQRFDRETGEPEYDDAFSARGASVSACAASQPVRKVPGFNVPRALLARPADADDDDNYEPPRRRGCRVDANENYSLFPKTQVLTHQEEIIMGYNTTSHRMYFVLITLLYVLTRHFVVVAIAIEYAMHRWAHQRNVQNRNPAVYYRSPLHIFTSRFCPQCRVEVAMDRVIKMQDARMRWWRTVARTMSSS